MRISDWSSDVCSSDLAAILKRVRAEGDAALADYTSRFDRHDLDVSGWAVEPAQCRKALESISTELRDALELAAARIAAYHEKQKPKDSDSVDRKRVEKGKGVSGRVDLGGSSIIKQKTII